MKADLDIITGVAQLTWLAMTDNEKTCVRFGMFPHAKTLAAEAECRTRGVESDDIGRLLAVALMECAKNNGGMCA